MRKRGGASVHRPLALPLPGRRVCPCCPAKRLAEGHTEDVLGCLEARGSAIGDAGSGTKALPAALRQLARTLPSGPEGSPELAGGPWSDGWPCELQVCLRARDPTLAMRCGHLDHIVAE